MAGKILAADEHHEHVVLGGHSASRWFGATHALIARDGVSLHSVDSKEHSVTSLQLTEAEMDALAEAWARRKAKEAEEQKAEG